MHFSCVLTLVKRSTDPRLRWSPHLTNSATDIANNCGLTGTEEAQHALRCILRLRCLNNAVLSRRDADGIANVDIDA